MAGFNLERLTLNPGATHTLILDTADVLEAQHLRVSLMPQYQHDSLVLNANGVRVGALVGQRLSAQLMAAYSLGRLEFGLQLPMVFWQGGDDLTSRGVAPVTSTALGSAIIQARYAFLRQAKDIPLDFAATLALALPTGNAAALTVDPASGLAFFPKLSAAHSFGFVRLGGEVGVAIQGSAVLSPGNSAVVDEVGSRFITGLALSTNAARLNAELSARMVVPFTQAPLSLELLAGGRYAFLNKLLEVSLLAGPGFGKTPGTPLFRVMAGLAFTPNFASPVGEPPPMKNADTCIEGKPYPLRDCPMLDRDADGVINGNDSCPNQAGTAAMNGCPADNALH